MLLTYQKSAGFRCSDEGDDAQGNRQHGDIDEGGALFQTRLACGCPLTILDNGRHPGWLSEAFGVGSRELSRVVDARLPRPGNGLPPGLAHQRQVGIFGANDASGVDPWSRYGAPLRDAHYLINKAVLTPYQMFFPTNAHIVNASRGKCCLFCATVTRILTMN
jgi:hypothetical protein